MREQHSSKDPCVEDEPAVASLDLGAADDSLKRGALVRIRDLKSRPNLNGRKGLIRGEIDFLSGFWSVQILGTFSERLCLIKSENLKVISGTEGTNIESSGRNEFDWQHVSADAVLQELIDCGILPRLAEFAFDPEEIFNKFNRSARLSAVAIEEEKMAFFANLNEIVSCEKVTSLAICDIDFVAEGLKRIYDGARHMAQILPRRSMCPLDIPLLESLLMSVKISEFMFTYRKEWISISCDVFQMLFNYRCFWQRCAVLSFPTLARFPGPSISPGTIAQERDCACEMLTSPAAKEIMRSLWNSATNLTESLSPNAIPAWLESIAAIDRADVEDTVICICCIEHAMGIAQRGPAE